MTSIEGQLLNAGPEEAVGGQKSITFLASFALLLNNILGPGLADFPGLFQQVGWLPPMIFASFLCCSSLIVNSMLVEAMRLIPGNGNFEQRIEFANLCHHYFSSRWAKVSVVIFLLSMALVNISTIVQTAQSFDFMVDHLFGQSCALELSPNPGHFFCRSDVDDISPFGRGKTIISVGLVIVALLCVPLGYLNLDDNMIVQIISLFFIVISLVIWLAIFVGLGLEPDRVPLFTGTVHNVGGTVLFNFMFICTIPSWICEKKPEVSEIKAVGFTLVVALITFAMVGTMGGMAFAPYYDTDNTLLSKLNQLRNRHRLSYGIRFLAPVSAYIYTIFANLSSIPVFSILIKYNLVQSGICRSKTATLLSVSVPWVAAVLLYVGEGFKSVVNLTGSATSALVNLIIPALFYLLSQRSTRSSSARELDASIDNTIATELHNNSTPVRMSSVRSIVQKPSGLSALAWTISISMTAISIACLVDQGLGS